MTTTLPVTVLSGYLWAGKTTLLKNILTQDHGKKLAVIVNDMAEINIDNRLVENQINITQTDEKLVEMSNGCICCTLREDLLKEVKDLCEEGKYDGIVIESTWVGEPIPVAQTFSYVDEETGIDLGQHAHIDTMVTVVDATTLLDYFYGHESLQDHETAVGEDDERTVTQLLVDQIEFCDVCVVNKRSSIDEEQQKKVLWVVRWLQADAKIITTDYSDVPVQDIIDTGLFDFDKASASASWIKELEHEHIPETEEYGIGSFTYQQKRPFHPERLWDFFHLRWEGLVRGKWFAWLASRPDAWLEWSLAWTSHTFSYGWRWMASLHPQEIAAMDDPETTEAYNAYQKEPHGDRMTQFVFIGMDLNKEMIISALDACLVTDEEREQSFLSFSDPFEDMMAVPEQEEME